LFKAGASKFEPLTRHQLDRDITTQGETAIGVRCDFE